jgi:hypothetical protein
MRDLLGDPKGQVQVVAVIHYIVGFADLSLYNDEILAPGTVDESAKIIHRV